MENLKIKVNNEAESKEAQELFFELGYTWSGGKDIFDFDMPEYIVNWNNGYITVGDDFDKNRQEITLPELSALVSLHKNPINMDKVLSEVRSDALGLLEDKEWLNTKTYEYKKAVDMGGHSNWIEIPEGADVATSLKFVIGAVSFLKRIDDSFLLWSEHDGEWGSKKYKTITKAVGDNKVLWQRHTQPEELPFVDDEPSLNDQYAEIEQTRQTSITDTLNERQSTYGSFVGVANTTGQLMSILLNSKNGYSLPYAHQEALHMICSKMARIVNGDPNHKDSWHDIAGYATLIENL